MSDWTNEKHQAARNCGDEGVDAAEYLDPALDEIERLWALDDDPSAVDVVAQEICDAARLPGAWDMSDEFGRASFRKAARLTLRAALNPEGGEQA